MVVLSMLGVITAGAFAARIWAAKDQYIAHILQENLRNTLPDCDVQFEAVRLVDSGHLEMTHLLIRSRHNGAELARVPRIVVEIETEILRSHRRLVIRELTAQSPEVVLYRAANQEWNWQQIRFQPPKSAVSPTWIIKNGTVRIGCVSPTDDRVQSVTLQGIQIYLQPDSFQRYSFIGTSVADVLGPVQVNGTVDSQTGEWDMQGSAGAIRLNDSLLDLAGKFHPEVHQRIGEMREANRVILAQTKGNQPVKNASNDPRTQTPPASPGGGAGNSLMRADVAIHFEAGQAAKGAPLSYEIIGNIDHGHISDTLLPIPLFDLEGRFRLAPDVLEISDLKAANGPSTLFVNGIARKAGEEWSKNFQIRAMQLHLDERIRGFLWGQLAKTFDMLSPSGTFDVDIAFSQKPGEAFAYSINKFKVIDCRGLCDYFRYPVEHINGEVTQEGKAFYLNMKGEANGLPVALNGRIDLTNPERDIELRINLANFPFDTAVRNAFQRPEQQIIRKILDQLQVTGLVKQAEVDIIRGGETNGKVEICVQGELENGTLNYVGFPYEVNQLSGKLTYNPLQRDTWIFEDVSGTHGQAKISGRGFYDLEQNPGVLELEMNVLQAALDHDLQKASVAASPALATVWNDFSIKGMVDIDKVSVTWTPTTPIEVALDGIHWSNGQFIATALPYLWSNVSGTLAWQNRRLKIHSLHGDHHGTYLLIDGAATDSAYIEIEPSPDVAWKMFLEERILHIVKLNPDDELRRALPVMIADAVSAVDLRNPIDLSLGLEMKGWVSDRQLITASWSALAALKENSVNTGVLVSGITGNVIHRGSWDGQNLWMEGYAELESLHSLELAFQKARGPFLLKNNRLTLGTPKLSGNEPVYSQSNPYYREQLRANTYGGQIGLDVDVALGTSARDLTYQIELNVNNAELGDWAQDHGMNSQRLMGKVNGVLQATGKGNAPQATTGQGWIQITPAALYELPVFAQMFTVLSFRPAQPGDAAFKYAYGDFTIHDEMFEFTKIELWGDAISLVGRGNVGYSGSKASSLELDFYSMANNRIPFLGPLVKAVSDRWIRVQIFGTISQPVARVQPRIPYLNDAFAGFMQSLESGQPQRQPPRPIQNAN